MAPTLKIGILLRSKMVSNWAYTMFSELLKIENIELAVLMYRNNSLSTSSEKKHSWILDLYRKFDQKTFKANLDAFKQRSLDNLVKADELFLEYTPGERSLMPDDLNRIKAYNLDVILKFDPVKLQGPIYELPKYGIWSMAPNDDRMNPKSLAGFLEVTNQSDTAAISLLRLSSDSKKNKVLVSSSTLTDNLSVERNNNRNFWKASQFVPRELKKILRLGEQAYLAEIEGLPSSDEQSCRTIAEVSNLSIFWAVIKLQLRRISKILTARFRFDQWILLFKTGAHDPLDINIGDFRQIVPPKDRFWADPFVLQRDQKYYVFLEELIYSQNKGFISVMEVDAQGNYSKPVKILEEPYHLSYPFIFEDKGQLYMIPETKNSKSIRLYKCLDFPYKWKFQSNLIEDVLAVDSTIAHIDNTYWLFTNMAYNKETCIHDELHLFYADSLESNSWKPHPENPIVSDVKKARPAGNLFFHNGSWYRPSQNCAKRYGYGLQLNKIIEINEQHYKEELVSSIVPDTIRKMAATHTLNSAADLVVMDAQIRRSK